MDRSPFNLPKGIFLLVSDQLSSPADFILYQSVSDHFKHGGSPARCCVLGVSEGMTKWNSVLARFGVNLQTKTAENSFHFVDVLSHCSNHQTTPLLKSIFDYVSSLLKEGEEDWLIILDDITSLEWTGFASDLELCRFARALRALCLKANASLTILHHILSLDNPLTPLFTLLLEISTYHLEVLPLLSGKSPMVSGEIALHAGPSATGREVVKTIPRSAAVQYRLSDSGVVYFERGNASGVL